MSPRTLTGRAILELMASDGACRFVREIAAGLCVASEAAGTSARTLARRGFLERTVADGVAVYRITEAGQAFLASNQSLLGPGKGGCAVRHRTSLRARAWNVMRMRDWWSVADLLTIVADGTETNAERGLVRYVRALAGAGYLVESRREKGRWHLSSDTGRLAPALNTQAGTLTDPNTGEVFDVRNARH